MTSCWMSISQPGVSSLEDQGEKKKKVSNDDLQKGEKKKVSSDDLHRERGRKLVVMIFTGREEES